MTEDDDAREQMKREMPEFYAKVAAVEDLTFEAFADPGSRGVIESMTALTALIGSDSAIVGSSVFLMGHALSVEQLVEDKGIPENIDILDAVELTIPALEKALENFRRAFDQAKALGHIPMADRPVDEPQPAAEGSVPL